MTTTETLPHRSTIPMPLFDAEQPAQLERVKANIAPLILAWFEGKKPGDEFYLNDLTDFVRKSLPSVAPDSAGRIMRDLKRAKAVNYKVDRARSLYRVTEPGEVAE